MKRILLIVFALSLMLGLAAQVLSCRDIQKPDESSGNSPYLDQKITVRAIVTAVRTGVGFYLGDESGGPFSGLYVHGNFPVSIGDKVSAEGEVREIGGITQLQLVTAVNVTSSDNPVPITDISTADLPFDSADSEPYEGVLVRFTDVKISSEMDNLQRFRIADNSGVETQVYKTLYTAPVESIVEGESWYQMLGVVDYHNSTQNYRILPRAATDLIRFDDPSGAAITLQNVQNVLPGKLCTMNVITTRLKEEWDLKSYEMKIKYDPNTLLFQGFDTDGTLSTHTPNYPNNDDNTVVISYEASEPFYSSSNEDATLIKLVFEPLGFGDFTVELLSFKYGNKDGDYVVSGLTNGKIKVEITENIAYLSIGTEANKKNIFDPLMNEKLEIEFGTKKGFLARALIRIFDAQGRLVATPLNQNFTNPASIEKTSWNGRDSNMKILPAGLYYCHLEISNRESGGRFKTVQPIVIKSRLK